MKKLEPEHKHILKLIHRDSDITGWTAINKNLFPILANNISLELVIFEKTKDGGRAKLTENGEKVVYAMDWI